MSEYGEVRSVQADINYLAPGSPINRRFVAPGAEVNTGTYELHRMQVRDGRSISEQFHLDTHGFAIAGHKSAVRDFLDAKEVDAVYADEVVETVRRLTGADLVAKRGWMVRSAGEKGYTRFIASSLWRTFSPPPQDWPLALCDGSTVAADDGTTNALIIVDAIPDRATMLGDWPGEEVAIKATIFRHNPNHSWWYFSNMHRDEVILLKFHDSDRNSVLRVPHTAFHDRSFHDARPRQSIEFRTFAYFRQRSLRRRE